VIDHDDEKLARLSEMLKSAFDVKYNTDLQLLTIRHYDQNTVASLTTGNEILLEQKSRQTLRIAMRPLEDQA
jgi:aspartate kinase